MEIFSFSLPNFGVYSTFADEIVGKSYKGSSFSVMCYIYFNLHTKDLNLNSQIQTFKFKLSGNLHWFLCFSLL